MTLTAGNILLVCSVLLFVSIVVSKTGYKVGIPTLLLFLFVGMLFGSDGLGIQFYDAEDAQFVGMVALSIILFSGGMDTRLADIRPVLAQGLLLSTVGVLLTTLFTGLFVHWISGFSHVSITLTLATSMLLAATMSSTDSASVFNILRSQQMNLKHNLRPMLELESGSNDPMAYMLTLVLIQFIQSGGLGWSHVAASFAVQFVVGGAAGYLLGKAAVWVINRIDLPNPSLYPILLLSFVFFIFTVTDLAGGNGYLAVYLAGILVGNARITNRREIATFMDGLTWLFQILMFLVLGLLVNPHEMLGVALPATAIGLFMMLVARPLSVTACLLPFRRITPKSRLFVSWVGLRGAVPIIFATYPVVADIPCSNQLFNIVFFITILSLVVQGSTISRLARRLRLDLPLPPSGNTFGVELPDEIDSQLSDLVLTEEMLARGDQLKDMNLPAGTLVVLVKRDDEFLIPNGTVRLKAGDKLLLISEGRDGTPSAPVIPRKNEALKDLK
ncbi:MAG: potassium/proton antiporter [Bacteroidaceae bacterium]